METCSVVLTFESVSIFYKMNCGFFLNFESWHSWELQAELNFYKALDPQVRTQPVFTPTKP